MSKKINNVIIAEDIIYLNTIEDRIKQTVRIDLRKSGLYGNNEKAVTTKILEYAIENNCEFNNKQSIMKPYYLTMKKLNNESKKKQYIIDNDLLYHEFRNSIAELHQQFYNIKQYLYENTEIKLNENGKVDKIGGIYVPIQFKEAREKFKEPLRINIDEFGEAIREIHDEICNCRYIISDDGKRYIVLANENELEDNKELQIMKNKNVSEYLKLVSERNLCFSKYTGISDIFFINDNFCIEDTYSECLSYNIRKKLIEYLQQIEIVDNVCDKKRGEKSMNEEKFVIDVNVTVDENEKMIYLYEEDGSGCKYSYGNMQELGEIFKRYIEDTLFEKNKNNELEIENKVCELNKDAEEEL